MTNPHTHDTPQDCEAYDEWESDQMEQRARFMPRTWGDEMSKSTNLTAGEKAVMNAKCAAITAMEDDISSLTDDVAELQKTNAALRHAVTLMLPIVQGARWKPYSRPSQSRWDSALKAAETAIDEGAI